MKKYSFRLQAVLDIRENELEDKRLEMAKVIRVLNEQQDKLTQLKEKQSSYKGDFDGMSENPELDLHMVMNYQEYFVHLNQEIARQENEIENTKKVLRVKQQEVNNAYKEVKILEKLKEKQSNKFYKDFEKKEANEIDDIITSRQRLKV